MWCRCVYSTVHVPRYVIYFLFYNYYFVISEVRVYNTPGILVVSYFRIILLFIILQFSRNTARNKCAENSEKENKKIDCVDANLIYLSMRIINQSDTILSKLQNPWKCNPAPGTLPPSIVLFLHPHIKTLGLAWELGVRSSECSAIMNAWIGIDYCMVPVAC